MLNQLLGAAGNKVTESSEENILTRLVNSVVGVLIGIVLFFLSFVILWWNEGNVIAEKGALEEMRKAMVKVSAEAPSPKQNGKLVYAQSELKSDVKVGDAPYIKPGKFLAVERVVEMYQWTETAERSSSKSVGGGRRSETTYSYKMEWHAGRQDSAQFKMAGGHENPALPVQPQKVIVAKSTFGKFDGTSVLQRLAPRENLPVTKEMLVNPKDKKLTINKGLIYLKNTPAATTDALGDVRISYRVVKQGPYSVMARQMPGNKLGLYKAKNGKEKFLVDEGRRTPKEMINIEKESAGTMAMFLRIAGFFCMWIGLNLLTGPIVTLLDVIPFLGTAGRFVLGLIWGVVAFVLSAVTIVVSMIAHHPVLLVLFLAGGAGAAYYYVKVYKPQKVASGGSRQTPKGGSGTGMQNAA